VQKCALAIDENAGEIGQTHRERESEREKGDQTGEQARKRKEEKARMGQFLES
jgi:hypothetical protein